MIEYRRRIRSSGFAAGSPASVASRVGRLRPNRLTLLVVLTFVGGRTANGRGPIPLPLDSPDAVAAYASLRADHLRATDDPVPSVATTPPLARNASEWQRFNLDWREWTSHRAAADSIFGDQLVAALSLDDAAASALTRWLAAERIQRDPVLGWFVGNQDPSPVLGRLDGHPALPAAAVAEQQIRLQVATAAHQRAAHDAIRAWYRDTRDLGETWRHDPSARQGAIAETATAREAWAHAVRTCDRQHIERLECVRTLSDRLWEEGSRVSRAEALDLRTWLLGVRPFGVTWSDVAGRVTPAEAVEFDAAMARVSRLLEPAIRSRSRRAFLPNTPYPDPEHALGSDASRELQAIGRTVRRLGRGRAAPADARPPLELPSPPLPAGALAWPTHITSALADPHRLVDVSGHHLPPAWLAETVDVATLSDWVVAREAAVIRFCTEASKHPLTQARGLARAVTEADIDLVESNWRSAHMAIDEADRALVAAFDEADGTADRIRVKLLLAESASIDLVAGLRHAPVKTVAAGALRRLSLSEHLDMAANPLDAEMQTVVEAWIGERVRVSETSRTLAIAQVRAHAARLERASAPPDWAAAKRRGDFEEAQAARQAEIDGRLARLAGLADAEHLARDAYVAAVGRLVDAHEAAVTRLRGGPQPAPRIVDDWLDGSASADRLRTLRAMGSDPSSAVSTWVAAIEGTIANECRPRRMSSGEIIRTKTRIDRLLDEGEWIAGILARGR